MAKADPIKKNLLAIHAALADAKALDVVVLDVRKVSDFTDYMVIVTGTSTRHVVSVAEKVVDTLRAQGVRAAGMEGHDAGEWVLIDFGGVVVHIMRQQARDFYGLEKLWGDGKPVDLAVKVKPVRAPKKAKSAARKPTRKR
jgi:ribosome-associated protein